MKLSHDKMDKMDNFSISYALLETSLGNSVDAFLDKILAEVKVEHPNQSSKNMSTEQMNALKERISSLIDMEIEFIMETMNGVKNNNLEQNNNGLFSEKSDGSSNKMNVVDNTTVSRKEESLFNKAANSDEISELDLALIISEEDSKETPDFSKIAKHHDSGSENSISRSSINFGSQVIQKFKNILTSSETSIKQKKLENNSSRKQFTYHSKSEPKTNGNLQALVNQDEEKHLELALAMSKVEEKKGNGEKEIQESEYIRENQNYDRYNNELGLLKEKLRLMHQKNESDLIVRRKEEERIKRESIQTKVENLNIQRRIVKTIQNCINGYDLGPYTKNSMKGIKLWIDCYNALSVPRIQMSSVLENDDLLAVNDISLVALQMLSILKNFDKGYIKSVFSYIRPHVEEFSQICLQSPTMCLFDSKKHVVDQTVDSLHPIFLKEFERVQIRGDGNCLWSSISVAMFGDYSFMESLRLLTAATLIKYKQHFESCLIEQRDKFGYRHDLSFEQLIEASIELNVWGDEYHLLALSLALHRPIVSYGSFAQISNLRDDMSYRELKLVYERENQVNHMLYVGDSDDEYNMPICIYYNGENHYCAILPRRRNVEPLIPKTQLFNYVIDRNKQLARGYKTNYSIANEFNRIRSIGINGDFVREDSTNRSDYYTRTKSLCTNSHFSENTDREVAQGSEKLISKNEIQESKFKKFNRLETDRINDYHRYDMHSN